MPINVNVVPKPLIPLFQGGGIKNLWDLAEEFGSGLSLFNAIKRAFPYQPGGDYQFYTSLVSWLQQFIRSTQTAADYLNNLPSGQVVDTSVLPKNFYLRRPKNSNCGFMIQSTWSTMNTATGAINPWSSIDWFNDLSDLGAIREKITTSITKTLSYVSASNKKREVYELVKGSLSFNGAVRIC